MWMQLIHTDISRKKIFLIDFALQIESRKTSVEFPSGELWNSLSANQSVNALCVYMQHDLANVALRKIKTK